MKRNLQIFLLGILLLLSASPLQAQKLTIESFGIAAGDLTARTAEGRVNDANGNPCALVKVHLAKAGAVFYGDIVGTPKYKQSEYWVSLINGTKHMQVNVEGYLPLMVDFPEPLESLTTYKLVLTMPQTSSITEPQTATAATANPAQAGAATQSFTVKGVQFTMVRVEAGTFTMGATPEMSDPESDEMPAHQVTLTNSYYMGQTEVTQALWQAVMGSNPSYFKGSNKPVECVSWNDCQTFIGKLNALTGKNFRLPTEAEWEFAARGGNKSRHTEYSGSSDPNAVAWYHDNSGSTTHDVATKQANELGLYDMSGNVWEWCSDWKGSYSGGSQTNPTGAGSGSFRVCRGGSWCQFAWVCRSSSRGSFYPDGAPSDVNGLRLALSE